ncbi:FecCD family ABC transporter permease [Ascidiimonas sp. W6]|uniref:FecCD family ABC transporter permease n=1 Tax=Ascidiimonas meishanensis TaxID=3128903 RepID=UPI0030EF36E2
MLVLLLVCCFFVNISLGSVKIPIDEIISMLVGNIPEKSSWSYILFQYRLPKSITAILTGAALSLSGLLMQTLFRNPLAGPFVLGISSGASLGVALLIFGTAFMGSAFGIMATGTVSIAIAASLGAFLVLLAVMMVATRIRDTMAILIIGLMFGSITSAVVSVLSFFGDMERLQQYIFWSFGSLGNLSWYQISLFTLLVVLGSSISILALKSLNSLLLGENYARSLGVNIKRSRYTIIIATSLLAGSVTAFAGPIAFIGLAVPHLTRQLINTPDHRILMPGVILLGAVIMLVCDTIAQLPASEYTLPINAITSLIGAPVVIWLLVKRKRLIF